MEPQAMLDALKAIKEQVAALEAALATMVTPADLIDGEIEF